MAFKFWKCRDRYETPLSIEPSWFHVLKLINTMQADVPKRSGYMIILPKSLQLTSSCNKLYIYIYDINTYVWLYPPCVSLIALKTDWDSRKMHLTSLAKGWNQSKARAVLFIGRIVCLGLLCYWCASGFLTWIDLDMGFSGFNHCIVYQITWRFLWILFLLGKTLPFFGFTSVLILFLMESSF